MPTSLTLIAIPKGLSGSGSLEVSLVVAPRLTGSHVLGAFPLMQRWTEILARDRPGIKLRFDDAVVDATPRYEPLRPDIWLELFTAETPVEPFAFDDRSKSLVISYPTRRALDLVKESYQRTAGNPGASMRYARSALDWVGAGPLKDGIAGARRRAYGAQSGQDKPIDDVWTAFSLFYRMPQPGPDAPDPLPRSPERLAAVFDFHKAVSALMAHPSLARSLGLVIDMTVPAGKVAVAGTSGVPARTMAVEEFRLPAMKQRTRFQRPAVLYHHAPGTAFAAADPERRRIRNGFVDLPEQGYHLFDLDLEGAMAKLGAMKSSMERAGFAAKDDGGELPALRSSGLSLAMDNQATFTNRELVRSRDIDTGFRAPAQAVALSASDLLRGYRFDVWSRSSGNWRSLHQRSATYRFGDDGRVSFEAAEEGFSQPAATSPVPDPARERQSGLPPVEDDLYVHEALVRWNGWSLSVPRPQTPLHRSNTHEPMEEDTSGDEFVTAFKLRQSFQVVPRSLPKLRFGNAYRMRVRAVDIAGNSPDFDIGEGAGGQADPPRTLPPGGLAHSYYRYEPVPHPMLLMRDVPESSRESLERVVIRSFNADISLDREPSADAEARHVAPPRCSVELAERHGVLDDTAGALKSDGPTFADLVARNDAVTRTERLGTPPTDTPIERGPQVRVDYLADPIARTAALRDLPGMPPGLVSFCGDAGMADTRRDPFGEAGPVLKVSFGDNWPQRRAFRLELAEGEDGPAWDATQRVLTVQLPKGESKAVSLSSAMSEADLDLMGVWAWLREKITADQARLVANAAPALVSDLARHAQATEQLIRRAREGGLWALTPSRAIRLVHAVQQPLGRPKFGCGPVQRRNDVKPGTLTHDAQLSSEVGLVALRRPNSAEAVLVGSIEAHVASTGRIDIHAAWTDVEDDGTSAEGVRRRPEKSLVEPIIIGEGQVSIKAEGTGDRLVARVVDGTRLEMTPDDWSTEEQPAVAPIHRFGDTRHRMVTYTPVSASRFISDFGEASGLDFTRTGEATTIAVPNSARPQSPRIVQVLPIFGWQRERVGTVATSVRSGFGLRVYFDRPWFLTGDGERLGVLLWPYGRRKPSDVERRDKLAGRVTEWALDAARKSGRLSDMPTRADVYGHDVLMAGVSHPNGLGSIDVAGFAVNFDAERGLWFSDITLRSQNAYMPFIRLALSRFQPHSIRNAEISVPASADFIQLTPDRSAVLVADPELPGVYHITVSGVGPEPTEHAPWRNRIEVYVERRRDDLTGDLGWSPADPADVTVTAKSTGANGASALYLGVVEFAATPERGRFRLVIREFETWRADDLRLISVPLPETQRDETVLPGLDLDDVVRKVPARPPSARSLTERALDKIEGVLPLQRTTGRLVYAEFIALEPSSFARDESKPPIGDGPVVGGPQPEEDAAWPPFAGPGGDAFSPQWDRMPVVDEATGEGAAGSLKLAQSMLNSTGVLAVPLELDGLFSPAVSAAVSAFRSATGFDATPALDARTWLALAVAAPFPALDTGLGGSEMTGPPVAYLQRLLNIGSAAPIGETGSYTSETRDRVRSFQETSGILPTGIVDAATWDALADLMTQVAPAGVEEVVVNFDRARWRAGQPAFEVVSRRDIEDAVMPSSQPLDANWEDSSGCWIQLSDAAGRPLYRHIVGTPLNRGVESIGGGPDGGGGGWERAPEPPETVTLVFNLPRMAAARSLLIFGNVDADDAGAAALIGEFDPWSW